MRNKECFIVLFLRVNGECQLFTAQASGSGEYGLYTADGEYLTYSGGFMTSS